MQRTSNTRISSAAKRFVPLSLSHARTCIHTFHSRSHWHQDDEDNQDVSEDEEDGDAASSEDDGVARKKSLLDDDAEVSGTKFERQQQEIGERIKKLEEFNVGQKPWQLAGGVFPSQLL